MSDAINGFLAIDVGNSRIKIGFFAEWPISESADPSAALANCEDRNPDSKATRPGDSNRAPGLPHCHRSIAVTLDSQIPWNEICGWWAPSEEKNITAIIAGSNPDAIARLTSSWPSGSLDQPREVASCEDLDLQVDLPDPSRVGIDRLLNAVAVNSVRAEQRSAVIVDCGTATTIDVMSAQGAFQGGAILPGFQLIAASLNQYTALLPLISLDELAETLKHEANAPPAIGKSTRQAIQSGIYWSQIGAVREIVDRISDELATKPQLFLTGGDGRFLFPHFSDAQLEPGLSLQGLVLAAKREV